MHKHRIILKHFDLAEGKISFSKLRELQDKLTTLAESAEETAEELTLPVFEDLDLKRLAREQSWQGINERAFKRTIQDLEVEESPEELLTLLKS